MGKILRGILAVILGFVTLGVVVMIGEMVVHLIYPPPAGFDPHDSASIAAVVKTMPIGTLVSVVVVWALGIFAGAFVAARVAPGSQLAFGLSIGVLGLLAAVATMLMIPHPIWMWVVGVAECLPAAYLGARLASPRGSRLWVGA